MFDKVVAFVHGGEWSQAIPSDKLQEAHDKIMAILRDVATKGSVDLSESEWEAIGRFNKSKIVEIDDTVDEYVEKSGIKDIQQQLSRI